VVRPKTSNTRFSLFYAVALLGILLGCSGKNDDGAEDAGGGQDSETDAGTPQPKWTVTRVTDQDGNPELSAAGLHSRLAVAPDERIGLVFWANQKFEDGICTEIQTDPPTRLRQTLYYAEKTAGGSGWSAEIVDEPAVAFEPAGVDLAFNPAGEPVIAYTGGDPDPNYNFCGANDAVLARRTGGAWIQETASALSGDSATGDAASDAGFVVGLWPALAFDAQGNAAVLHKDVHFGYLQSDDKRRADAEFAWYTGAGWIHEAVDYGDGAGDYGDLVFDAQGRPIAVFALTIEAQAVSRHGVWAARRVGDRNWEEVMLHKGAISQEIDAGINPVTGELVVAFYSAKDYAVKIRRLSDMARFTDAAAWATELVAEGPYDEGEHVSLDFTPSGNMALAYHRCRRLTDKREDCNQNDEAVIFAVKQGADWRYEVVKKADVGQCGEYTSLAIAGDGTAHVSFRCTDEQDQVFSLELFEASKKVDNL
jgi:hypothetical protein